MKKALEIIRFYSLDEINKYISEGGNYPLHHIWCYDQFEKNGYKIDCVEYDKKSMLNIIGTKIGIPNLQQQLKCIKNAKEYDYIFAPFMKDALIIIIIKMLKMYKKPLIVITDNSHKNNGSNILKNIKRKIERYLYFTGVDKILFLNENIYNQSKKYGSVPLKHKYLNNWGIDYEFFNKYLIAQKEASKRNYIYTTGGSNRDLEILIKAFTKINYKLYITTKDNIEHISNQEKTSNIFINTSIVPGLNSVSQLLEEYYNSFAVAIPLKYNAEQPNGVTVMFEAMAMAKAIITTQNKMYPFDVEKEKVGLNVEYGDTDGWIQAINYLIAHPEESIEMGQRGLYLIKTKYNYQKFTMEIFRHITEMNIKQNI